MYDSIEYTVDDPLALIALNRPDRLNALTVSMLEEIRDAVARAEADPAVVAIVVTGNGRGFCAGLDAEALADLTASGEPVEIGTRPDDVPGMFTYLLAVPKPVIAAVNGVAAGGGFVLAAMADLRFASVAASFTPVFSRRGLIAEHGLSWVLPRLISTSQALDLLWTSRKIDAAEAAELGLARLVREPDDLLGHVRAYVEELSRTVSPASMRDTKHLVYRHLGMAYPEALAETIPLQWEAVGREDAAEGVASLLERRDPAFRRLGS